MKDTVTSIEHQEEVRKNADLLKAIAHPVRLCLVRQMHALGKCNVSYFCSCMNASQSSISQHLAKLRDMGIVDYEKAGQNVNYFIKDQTVERIIEVLFPEDERSAN